MLITLRTHMINPLTPFFIKVLKFPPIYSSFDRSVAENCQNIRNSILEYVRKRKQGKNKSSVSKDADLLSLMISSPEIFNDDFIVDELIDFFTAAVQTTQNAS